MSPTGSDPGRLDRPQLTPSLRFGLLAVFLIVVVSPQLAVGTAVASPVAGDHFQDGTTAAESEMSLDPLGDTNASHGLTVELEYSDHASSIDSSGVDSDFTDHRLDAGTSYPADEPIISESAVDTLSAYAEDVSPPAFLTLVGYSRYDNSDPLAHERRATLHEQIQSNVGITLADLISTSDVSESTVRYHTRILEEESLVEKVDLWGNVRLFPAEYSPEEQALTVALDETALRNVLSAVGSQDPATVSTVAAEIDRAPSTVSHHLSRLEAADLVDQKRDGKRVVTTLKPAVRRALTAGTVETEARSQIVGD